MRRVAFYILLICNCIQSAGQGRIASLAEAAALLSGAGSEEELDEEAVEHFERLAASPLNLNRASMERLTSSGLLSRYQAASLEDYREKCGDILSFSELATVNGFDSRTADALRYFVTLSGTMETAAKHKRWAGDHLLRYSRKDGDAYAACKVAVRKEGRAEFFWSTRGSYAEPSPPPGTFSLALYSRGGGRLIAGDFNARLGQGLLLWSGFSTGGFPTADAFVRRAGGFSPTGSFSPSMRGIAVEYPRGEWCFRAAAAPFPILSVSKTGRSAELGLNMVNKPGHSPAVSTDWKAAAGGVLFFGEGAVAMAEGNKAVFACTGGLQFCPAYKLKAVLSARYYPQEYDGSSSGAVRTGSKASDEKGLAAGIQWKWFCATLDAVRQDVRNKEQLKSVVRSNPDIKLADCLLSPSLQWTVRHTESKGKQSGRKEIRTDLRLQYGNFLTTFRGDFVSGRGRAKLFYLEPGYKSQPDSSATAVSLFVRGTLFNIDKWDDRIYAWGRDVPGTFTVPAYYGQGYELAVYAGGSLRQGHRRHSLWLRASFLRYKKGQVRTPHDEVRLQYNFKW